MLGSYDRLLLDLYGASHSLPAQDFPTFVMGLLASQLRFDSARFVTISPPTTNAPMRVHGAVVHNEPVEMVLDWESINKIDIVLHSVLEQPSRALRFHSPTLYAESEKAVVLDYVTKYRHMNGLVIAAPGFEKGQMEGLSLYRANPDEQFKPADMVITEKLMAHLQSALRINHQLAVTSAGVNPAGPAMAILSPRGDLQFSTADFDASIVGEWPGCGAVRLPTPLQQAAECGRSNYEGTRVRFEFRRSGGLIIIAAAAVSRLARLTRRETEVARLFAQGQSYKEVARGLGIAPSTARNILQSAYTKLGVRDKGALATYLANNPG